MTNGADPLLTDERRHNTALHFASLYGHSECVHKLLGCRAGVRGQVRSRGARLAGRGPALPPTALPRGRPRRSPLF